MTLLRVEDLDDKEREYTVVSMSPTDSSDNPRAIGTNLAR